MAEKKTYITMRPHLGDKFYDVGDPREADPNRVSHLVAKGILEESAGAQVTRGEKAVSKAAKNKAVAEAPQNKKAVTSQVSSQDKA